MRMPSANSKLLWGLLLAVVAFARVHFRSVTTGIAYDLGQLKSTEGKLLEERSQMKGELAKLTTRKALEDLASRNAPPHDKR